MNLKPNGNNPVIVHCPECDFRFTAVLVYRKEKKILITRVKCPNCKNNLILEK